MKNLHTTLTLAYEYGMTEEARAYLVSRVPEGVAYTMDCPQRARMDALGFMRVMWEEEVGIPVKS